VRAPSVLYYAPDSRAIPEWLPGWVSGRGLLLERIGEPDAIVAFAVRGHPTLIVIGGDAVGASGVALCRTLKSDTYSAVVPVVFASGRHASEEVRTWFEAGADDVLTPLFGVDEQKSRLDVLILRTERNVSVHPSTRLPGTTEIERQIRLRLERPQTFAVCYADLDHFKEFNDRYSYYDGDRVILILSRILRDVVKGMCPGEGFVGHIGGDDFIVILPVDRVPEVCQEIIGVFDALIPFQYSTQDRRAGYFFGKDRRGQLYRVPLMTLSIGIVTNERRRFEHPAQVSGLATEMKSYAKTLPGSVFVVDRRQDGEGDD